MAKQNKPKFLGRFHLSGLFMVLFAAFALSSGMVGYSLGKNAARPSGKLMDTIVLSPGESSSLEAPAPRFLSGRLRDREGNLWAGVTVSLENEGKSDVTDSRGKFTFSEIDSGSHVLTVTGNDGGMLASTELSLDFSEDGSLSLDAGGAFPTFHVPEDARMLELTLTAGEDQTLAVEEKSTFVVTRDGQVVNFDGASLTVAPSTHVVLPSANIVAAQGYVMLPEEKTVLTPQGEELSAETNEEVMPGAVITEDGSVAMEEGVILLPTGEVQLPDGEILGGEDKPVIVTESGAEELDALPGQYTPAAISTPDSEAASQEGVASQAGTVSQTDASPSPANSANPGAVNAPSKNGASSTSGEPPAPEASAAPIPEADPGEEAAPGTEGVPQAEDMPGTEDAPQPEATPTPQPEAEPTPTPEPQGLLASDEASREKGVTWKQQSMIDLFRNLTDGADLGERDGVPVVAPGSKGYYEFQLENPEEFDIIYSLCMEEKSFHLPIRYSVTEEETGKSYLYRERIGGSDVATPEILIPAKSTQSYRIDWEWMYEDWFDFKRDDALDMAAATSQDTTYIVSVSISAEQAPNRLQPDPSSNPRYPGKR